MHSLHLWLIFTLRYYQIQLDITENVSHNKSHNVATVATVAIWVVVMSANEQKLHNFEHYIYTVYTCSRLDFGALLKGMIGNFKPTSNRCTIGDQKSDMAS